MGSDPEDDAGARLRTLLPDAALYLPVALVAALLPLHFGGYVHELSHAIYRLMWLNFVGHGYRAPLDTPKPLLIVRAGLLAGPAYFVAGAAIFATLAVFFARLSDRLLGNRYVGVGAFLLVFLGNGYVLPGPYLTAYWPITYYALLAGAVCFWAERRYGAAFSLLFLAGLDRPESWAYAAFLLLLLAWTDRGAFRWRYGLALLAPVAWILFDWTLAGDPLHSLHTLERYREYLGVAPVTAGGYWPKVIEDAAREFHPVLLAAGAAGGGLAVVTAREGERLRVHGALLGFVGIVLLGYWVQTFVTEIILHVRFLSPAVVLLLFYAAALPVYAFRIRGEGGGERERRTRGGSADTGRSGERDGGGGPERAVSALRHGATAAWLGLALLLGWSTGGFGEAREMVRLKRAQQEAREEAVAYLRDRWAGDPSGRLLAGRSVDYFALALGEEASRRMHQFRVVGRDGEAFAALRRGYCVYIAGDTAGHGARFNAFRRPRRYRAGHLLFVPERALGGGIGHLYRFEPAEAE